MERIKAVLTEVKYPDAEKETAERETGKTRLFYVLNVNYGYGVPSNRHTAAHCCCQGSFGKGKGHREEHCYR